MNFLHPGRQLLLTAAVDNMHFCSQAQCRPGSIHGHIAASYHSHLSALHNRRLRTTLKSFHQIASGQILIGRKDTVCVLSGNPHKLRQTCTGTDEHGVKTLLLNQFVNGNGFSHYHIGLYLNSQRFHILNLRCHHFLLGKTELRNTVNQHAPGLVKRFKNSHIISHFCQISGTGQSGRTGTYDRNAPALFLGCACGLDPLFPGPVGHKTLQFADGDRISLDPPDAFAFTLGLLGTYTATDRRKRTVLTDDLVGLLDLSFLYLFNKTRNIDRHRTPLDTLCILAVYAPGSFRLSLFLIISQADFLEIGGALFGILLSHRNSF